MQKVLRSLIHEAFPEELRVKIALLSRRRDIINAEKQEELFKLLREYNIQGVTPLGPGTNRYAFKLNGFVIKVATDHDGIIDNLKEFKMAKRLYPHVTKIYEVSENGTLLVAEYIQPFSSYGEMYQYADKIREILQNFSSVYLIGDVGVTQKNYANWGLRIGSDSPVCLDFAYVYDVSSELFVCRKCKSNSMLVPDKDFVKLMCPAKGCGAVYEFSDIRRRIGNDLHRQEIGDLSEEGYLLEDSNVLTELNPERSNYLEIKSDKKEDEGKNEEIIVEPDNFELDNDINYYKEGFKMNLNVSDMNLMKGAAIKATAVLDNDDIAFSGDMSDTYVIKAYPIIDKTPDDIIVQTPEPIEASVCEEVKEEEEYESSESKVENVVDPEEETIKEPIEEKVTEQDSKFSKKFLDGAHFAVSNVGKLMTESLTKDIFFDEIKTSISQKKLYPGDFYKILSTAIYKAIVGFCNFQQIDIPNKDKPGTHRGYKAPNHITGECYEPTMIFLQRIFIDERLRHVEDMNELMELYKKFYGDYLGLQREIIPSLRLEISKRVKIGGNGLDKLITKLEDLMFCPQEEEDLRIFAQACAEAAEEEEDTTLKDKLDAEIAASKNEEEEPMDVNEALVNAVTDVLGEINTPNEPDEEIAFSAELPEAAEEEYEDDEEENSYGPTTIEILKDGDGEILRIRTSDEFGDIVIPIYTDLTQLDLNEAVPSMVDDRNGDWDWLVHFSPMMRFYTDDPDKWLLVNENEIAENQVHPIILDELEDGRFVMGLYLIDGIYYIDDDGNYSPLSDINTIKKVNKAVFDNVSISSISHLTRTTKDKETIFEESVVSGYLIIEDVEEDEDEEDITPSEVENAAVEAMFEDLPGEEVSDEEFEEEETDENNLIFTPVHKNDFK